MEQGYLFVEEEFPQIDELDAQAYEWNEMQKAKWTVIENIYSYSTDDIEEIHNAIKDVLFHQIKRQD